MNFTTTLLTKRTGSWAYRHCYHVSKSKPGVWKCKACGGNFDLVELVEMAGHMICKFCIHDMETHTKEKQDV